MDPCPFVRIMVESLSLKLPTIATKPAGSGVHPSATPWFCKIRLNNFSSQTALLPLDSSLDSTTPVSGGSSIVFQLDPYQLRRISGKPISLHVLVYTGRMGSTCGVPSEKLLGHVRVAVDVGTEGRECVFQNGWMGIGKAKEGKASARLHLVVRSVSEQRFVFQFGGEPECSPVVFQIQGDIRQPVFSCKFRCRSMQLDPGKNSRGWLNTFGSKRERPGRERKGWMIMIHDLSGSPVAAASMITPFVPSPGSDRVCRSNPGGWLILRAHGSSISSWKPWARLEAWRERAPVDALGYRLVLVTDINSNSSIQIAESTLDIHKGGQFCIDTGTVGDFITGPCPTRGFVMSSTVEGDGKISKPTVQVGVQHVKSMADAAVFVALSAAIDLSMDACRLFSQKLRKELFHDQHDYTS